MLFRTDKSFVDFQLLRDTYSLIMNTPSSSLSVPPKLRDEASTHSTTRESRCGQIGIYSQTEFLERFGGGEVMKATRTRDGTSILEGMYTNANIMF